MKIDSPRFKRELNRFVKFLAVGTIGAIVDFSIFNLLNHIFGIWSVLASVLSCSAAVTSNFIWNRHWTYPDSRSKPTNHQAMQFALINLIGLAIRTPIFALSEKPLIRLADYFLANKGEIIAWFPDSLTSIGSVVIGRNLALAVAIVVVLFWNFAANRLWTYSDVS